MLLAALAASLRAAQAPAASAPQKVSPVLRRSQLPQYRAQVLHRLPRLRSLDAEQARHRHEVSTSTSRYKYIYIYIYICIHIYIYICICASLHLALSLGPLELGIAGLLSSCAATSR